jgi:hypothetical protein
MLFGIGTRVKFLRTPDAGIITDKLGDGMVMVHLDIADMEIPAFEEDLIREDIFNENMAFEKIKHEYQYLKKQDASDSKVSKSSPSTNNSGSDNALTSKSTQPILGHTGIYLAFEPLKKSDGIIEKFIMYLLNDTNSDVLFECELRILNQIRITLDSKIGAVGFEKLGEIYFDDINDAPDVDISVAPVYTEGVGEKQYKTLKIKAKQFLKNLTLSPFLNREMYSFLLFDKIGKAEKSSDDLKKYTDSIIKTQKKAAKEIENLSPFSVLSDVNEYATFVNEVDLHIELLHQNPQSLSNQDIIHIQLSTFENFLMKALRLGVKRVYIIHGVGKGRLKEMIHARLKRHSDIVHFKNEYHERYGWGATEVIL